MSKEDKLINPNNMHKMDDFPSDKKKSGPHLE